MSHRALVLPPPEAWRHAKVAGMPLLARASRIASAATGAPALVYARDEAESVSSSRDVDPSLVVRGGEWLERTAGTSLLVLSSDVVVDKRIIEALAREPLDPAEVVTVEATNGPSRAYLVGVDARGSLGSRELASREAFETWAASKSPRTLRPELDTISFAYVLTDAESERAAITALFQACIKPIDGIVSRNINRKLSIPISRALVNTFVTPNHVTALSLLVAVGAALVALRGDMLSLAIAGGLFQLNSVLDGVDGELARVRWAFSKLGEFLDSIGDDLSNFAYFGALDYVAFAHEQRLLGIAGAIGLVLWALYIVFLYFNLRGSGGGDVMVVSQKAMNDSAGFWQRAIEVARLLLRRDGFVFLAFLLAIVGRATWILPAVLVGGTSTFVFAARETVRKAFSK